MSDADRIRRDAARFDGLQAETRVHRRNHGCHAYTFEDGAGLLALARREGAARILELGTAIGYTAAVLASATPTTRVETIERDPEHVALARANMADADLAERVTVHAGDFATVLPQLDGLFDLVFFDGLGPTSALIDGLREMLAPGGLLVCGNLGLAADDERRHLDETFADRGRWHAAGSIENGATRAFRKIGTIPVLNQ